MINFKVATLLTAGAIGFLGAGLAAAQEAAPQITIHYNAAALDSDAGARQVYRRIRAAAEEVCGGATTSGLPSYGVVQCRRQAVDTAVAYIHNTRLAALSSHVKAG